MDKRTFCYIHVGNNFSKVKKKLILKITLINSEKCQYSVNLLLDRCCLSPPGQPVWTGDDPSQMRPFFAIRSPKKKQGELPALLYQHQPMRREGNTLSIYPDPVQRYISALPHEITILQAIPFFLSSKSY